MERDLPMSSGPLQRGYDKAFQDLRNSTRGLKTRAKSPDAAVLRISLCIAPGRPKKAGVGVITPIIIDCGVSLLAYTGDDQVYAYNPMSNYLVYVSTLTDSTTGKT